MTDYQFMDMIHAMELFYKTCHESKCEKCEQQEQCIVAEKHGFKIPDNWKC